MADSSPATPELSPRLRRVLELVYALDGVVGVRIWQWPGRVAVGVNVGASFGSDETLRRVEGVVAPLRGPEETWEFGLLGAA